MMQTQKAVRKCDRLARVSLIIGGIGAVLTGLVHYRYMVITYLNFTGHNLEYFLLLGSAILLFLLASVDLSTGFSAMHQIQQSTHKRSTKTMAIFGITLGFAEILPSALLLTIIVEVFLLRFMTLKSLFEF